MRQLKIGCFYTQLTHATNTFLKLHSHQHILNDKFLLNSFRDEKICVRQFGEGVKVSAARGGISVIIDVFRASNTILALLEAEADIRAVETIEEVLSLVDHIPVGELSGGIHPDFDYDNSPCQIVENSLKFYKQKVVVRTTNGTRGIKLAQGSSTIIMATFRNLTSVVNYCLSNFKKGIPISFIAMGSVDVSRIEDVFCAKMLYYSMIDAIEPDSELLHNEDNPWNLNWMEMIRSERFTNARKLPDYEYALQLDKTKVIPKADNNGNIRKFTPKISLFARLISFFL